MFSNISKTSSLLSSSFRLFNGTSDYGEKQVNSQTLSIFDRLANFQSQVATEMLRQLPARLVPDSVSAAADGG